jgi:N-ethylmaleimide reductase
MSTHLELLTPVSLGAMALKNRLVMAPLTRMRAIDGDVPSPLAKTYYSQRASAGMIITEATQISPLGKGYPATPAFIPKRKRRLGKRLLRQFMPKAV